ncbi:MAG: lamin tail domain-containing protein [bacterium]
MRKKGGVFYLVKIMMILAVIGAGFFCTQKVLASQSILISEVQITGGPGKTENDFIELYNHTNSPFNLKGYRLVKRTKTGTTDTSIKSWSTDVFIPANGYFLWANSNYFDISVTPNATTTATISSDNGVAIRFGAADTGVIIDSVAWGQAQNIFVEGSVFPTNPEANQSLERKINLDTDNNNADFFVQENPNPQNSGTVIITPPEDQTVILPEVPPTNNNTATSSSFVENSFSSTLPAEQKNNFGDVLINEFVSDPADNEVEWIEIFNKVNKEIDLTGWWIEEGSKAKTNLEGIIGVSGSGRYKIIEKPPGSLNNAGDIIILYDSSGKIIDQVVYGDWDDGNSSDNAPVAPDPGSTARKFDGYNTYNNLNDFAITIKPTRGASNIIQVEDEVSSEAKARFDFSGDILISEILPNPTGDDTKFEFIEIYNAGKREVNLTGWSISNEDNKKVNLEKIATSTIIKAGEFMIFLRSQTKIVLHNDQGQVKLFQPLADKPFITVDYKNGKEGWSYNSLDYKINGEWIWSETETPGAINIFKTVNRAPEVEFSFKPPALINFPVIFDSSDTNDKDDDKLKFSWDFGDGFKNNLANPEHTYLKAGVYKVKLEVSDGQEIGVKEESIKVVNTVGELEKIDEVTSSANGVSNNKKIIINEIFPNPPGADADNEWIELKNQRQHAIFAVPPYFPFFTQQGGVISGKMKNGEKLGR